MRWLAVLAAMFLSSAAEAQVNLEWTAESISAVEGQAPSAMVVGSSPRTVYVTGNNWRTAPSQAYWVTYAWDADSGQPVWSHQYPERPSEARPSNPTAMALSPDGRTLYVTGYAEVPDRTHSEDCTIAYDAATGDTLWVAFRAMVSGAAPRFLQADPGTVYIGVAGYSQRDYRVYALDASSGQFLWERVHANPRPLPYNYASLTAMALDEEGSIYLAGSWLVRSSDFYRYHIAKYAWGPPPEQDQR